MAFIIVYVTFPDKASARKIVNHLMDSRLIACANITPLESVYWWKGKKVASAEVAAILKTKNANWPKLKSEIGRLHPYEVPCIMRLEASANKAYEDWIRSETSKTPRPKMSKKPGSTTSKKPI